MSEFLKPDNLNVVWASGGDRLYPGDTKYASGWGVEIPPRQYFNEIDYKQDQMLAHINQHGISVWDGVTEYQAGKSYIQDSTGLIYRCVQTHSGQNPELDVSNTYWEIAFASVAELPTVSSATEAQQQTLDNVYISPLQLSNAFSGAKKQLSNNGFQIFPGGLRLAWASSEVVVASAVGSIASVTIQLPTTFSTIFNIQATQDLGSPLEAGEMVLSISAKTSTSVTVTFRRVAGNNTGEGGTESVRANILIVGN